MSEATAVIIPGAAPGEDSEQYINFAARAEARRQEVMVRASSLWPVVERVEDVFVRDRSLTEMQLCSESGVASRNWQNLQSRRQPATSDRADCWTIDVAEREIAKLCRWLDQVEHRKDSGIASLAPTRTTKVLFDIIAAARNRQCLEVIIGGYGVGKTVAADAAVREYPRRRNSPGVIRVEVSNSFRTVGQLLEHVLFRLQMRDPYKLPDQAQLMAELCRELRAGDVVILDECQRLAQCGKGHGIEAVRELYDSTPASFVLLGNEYMTAKGNLLDKNLYWAIKSRAHVYPGEFLHLSASDVDAYMAWRGVSGVKLRGDLVRLVAACEERGKKHLPKEIGGLRFLANLFDRVERLHGALSEDAILAELGQRA